MHCSRNILVSNEVAMFWKPFIYIFQLLCVSHFSVYRVKCQNNLKQYLLFLMYFLTFSTIHISLLAFDLKKGLHEGHNHPHLTKHRGSPLMFYVNCLSIFGRFAAHITAHLETLLNGKREVEIHRKLKKINNILKTKLSHQIDFKVKRSKNARRTVSVFVFATLLTIASSLVTVPSSNHDKYFSQAIFIFAAIIVRSRACHIALFLDFIADILNDLQMLMKQQQTKSRRTSTDRLYFKRHHIRYLREIYSNVWLVKTILSDCFGWSLITLLIEFAIELINSSYWLFINLNSFGSSNLNIREIQALFFC